MMEADGDSSPGDSTMDVDSSEHAELMETVGDEDFYADLSNSLILTNLPSSIFVNDDAKARLEEILKSYDEEATVIYFRSFKRARVTFSTNWKAAFARIHLNGITVSGSEIGCFIAQPQAATGKVEEEVDSGHLMPPKPTKQYLISPPSSPPVDWEQCHEAEPVINYDLLRAVSQLAPGESHELHPPTGDQPAIIVHICKDDGEDAAEDSEQKILKPQIVQTRCPERGS